MTDRTPFYALASSLDFCWSNSCGVITPRVAEVSQLGELVGGAAARRGGRVLDVRPERLLFRLRLFDVALLHAVPASDQVDEHAEERDDEHEDRPQPLAPPAEVVAAEDVDEHPEQDDDPRHPEEEPQEGPEHAKQWIVVRKHRAPPAVTQLGADDLRTRAPRARGIPRGWPWRTRTLVAPARAPAVAVRAGLRRGEGC